MSATRKELIQKYAHVSARLVYRAALFSLCCRREFARLTAQGLPPNEAAAQSIAKYCGLPASAGAAPGALHTAGSASPTARDVPGTSQGAGGTGGEPPRTTTSPVSAASSDPVVGAAAAVAGAGAGAGAGAAAVAGAGGTDASEDADEPMTSDVGMPTVTKSSRPSGVGIDLRDLEDAVTQASASNSCVAALVPWNMSHMLTTFHTDQRHRGYSAGWHAVFLNRGHEIQLPQGSACAVTDTRGGHTDMPVSVLQDGDPDPSDEDSGRCRRCSGVTHCMAANSCWMCRCQSGLCC